MDSIFVFHLTCAVLILKLKNYFNYRKPVCLINRTFSATTPNYVNQLITISVLEQTDVRPLSYR